MVKEIVKECAEYILKNRVKSNNCAINRNNTIKSKYILSQDLEGYLSNNRAKSFAEQLFYYIDRTGKSDSEIYKKAGIDRRLFSKIRSVEDYNPSKKTVLALAFALELTKTEVDNLLLAAGYSLSHSDDYDLAISFCFEREIFNFFDINDILCQFGFEVFEF